MDTPTPAMICAARKHAGHSQTDAGELIGATLRAWQNWEAGAGSNMRAMPVGLWELYLLKTGQHPSFRLESK